MEIIQLLWRRFFRHYCKIDGDYSAALKESFSYCCMIDKNFLLLWWRFSATFVWSMEIILLLWKRVSAIIAWLIKIILLPWGRFSGIIVTLMEIVLLLWRRVSAIIAWLIKIILLLWKTFSGIFVRLMKNYSAALKDVFSFYCMIDGNYSY